MSQKNELVPKRRFKEFENAGDWEERKLSDISNVITKGTTPKDKTWTGSVNYVKTESIDKNSGNISVTANTNIEEHEGYLKRSQLKEGDILFSIVGTLGRVGLVKISDLPANTNQQIAIIRLKNEINNLFIFQFLRTTSILNFIKSDATIGAQPSLSLWQINNLNILIPKELEEQQKIGSFFKQIDDTIALHQRKLDKLNNIKQSYLYQMFPQNGEKVPKMRFAEFNKEWKVYKFGDVVLIRRGLTYKPSNVTNDGIRVLRSSNINEDKFVLKDDDVFVNPESVNIDEIQEGDILITSANGSSRLVGKHAIVKGIENKTVHGGFMLVARATNNYFINALMSTEWY